MSEWFLGKFLVELGLRVPETWPYGERLDKFVNVWVCYFLDGGEHYESTSKFHK